MGSAYVYNLVYQTRIQGRGQGFIVPLMNDVYYTHHITECIKITRLKLIL